MGGGNHRTGESFGAQQYMFHNTVGNSMSENRTFDEINFERDLHRENRGSQKREERDTSTYSSTKA